jgi:hypothetical protein
VAHAGLAGDTSFIGTGSSTPIIDVVSLATYGDVGLLIGTGPLTAKFSNGLMIPLSVFYYGLGAYAHYRFRRELRRWSEPSHDFFANDKPGSTGAAPITLKTKWVSSAQRRLPTIVLLLWSSTKVRMPFSLPDFPWNC